MEVQETENFDCTELALCRTCGIYYILDESNIIMPIYTTNGINDAFDIPAILKLLSIWHIEVAQNDGRPQFICLICIGQFEKFIKFKNSCIETQDQFEFVEYTRQINGVIVKKEPPEEKISAFIYLDTDDEEDGSARVHEPDVAIPHVPIKLEHMARVPQEADDAFEPPKSFEYSTPDTNDSIKEEQSAFQEIKLQEFNVKYCIDPTMATVYLDLEDEEDDTKIAKFTYDDDNTPSPSPVAAVAPNTIFTCIHCSHQSDTQELLEVHVKRFHTLKNTDCHICGKTFTNASDQRVKFHMKWHKINKHLQCPICGYFCDSKDTLKEHRLAVHTFVKCEHCGKKVKRKLLKKHLFQHKDVNGKKAEKEQKTRQIDNGSDMCNRLPCCPFCLKNVDDALQLEIHLKKVHSSPQAQEAQMSIEEANITKGNTDQSKILDMLSSFSTSINELAEPQTDIVECAAAVSSKYSEVDKIFDDESDCTSIDTLHLSQDDSMLQLSNISMDSEETSETSKKACYKCHICGKAYDLKIKLNLHVKKHTKAPF